MKTTSLENGEFIEVLDGRYVHYGGNQLWFKPNRVGMLGGCGSVAAANLLAYLARNNDEYKRLYQYDLKNMSKEEFIRHMCEVYDYVTPIKVYRPIRRLKILGDRIPITLGLPTLSMLASGIKKFAKSRKTDLTLHTMFGSLNTEKAIQFIVEGLRSGSPVLLLICLNRNLKKVSYTDYRRAKKTGNFQRHWVTITAIHENALTKEATIDVSTWGAKATIRLHDAMHSFSFGGMLYAKYQR